MGDTSIEWCDKTWNPIRGCSRVSEGCRNCYAERVATRFSGPGQPYEGLVTVGKRHSENGRATTGVRGKWNGVVRMVPRHLADPLHWRRPRRVFVNSMSDLFHENLSNEAIAAVFGVMAAAPQHTFQVLTKRATRMNEWFEWVRRGEADELDDRDIAMYLDDEACNALAGTFDACHLGLTTGAFKWPLPNVWLGVSVENQTAADERIPELLATPAAVRFLSCEPLLDHVSLFAFLATELRNRGLEALGVEGPKPGVDWVIAGCESGPGARRAEVNWYRSLRDECAGAGVAFFLKQAKYDDPTGGCGIHDAGPVPDDKPGRLLSLPHLDGRQHAAFPEAR
jgi:protein gp37